MVFAFIIILLHRIDPSQEWLTTTYKGHVDLMNLALNSGLASRWVEIGRVAQFGIWMGLFIELAIEFIGFLKLIPKYVSYRVKLKRERPKYEHDLIETIEKRLANNYKLSWKQNRFYKKQMRSRKRGRGERNGDDERE